MAIAISFDPLFPDARSRETRWPRETWSKSDKKAILMNWL